MNFQRATAPATEDRSPDAWAACRRAVQPRGSGTGRGGRVLRRSTDASGLLAAADLRCPAGRDLPVVGPATADQEQFQDGVPYWARLGRVLPAGPPRLGLRGGPAQRETAGSGVVLSRVLAERTHPTAIQSATLMYKLAVSGQPAEGSVLPERISYMSCFRLFKPQGLFARSCRLI